jgi:hypothetical protein
MGQKRISKSSTDELLSSFIQMFVPNNILVSFEVWKVHNHGTYWTIELRERATLVPEFLNCESDQDIVVLDGFCNPIELLSLGFSQGPVYLRLYRRRWKRSSEEEHFSNTYDFKLQGYKMVSGIGEFFKKK